MEAHMNIKTRILIYMATGLIIPIGIFIYEKGYDANAMKWIVFVALLAVAYEVILKIKNRKE